MLASIASRHQEVLQRWHVSVRQDLQAPATHAWLAPQARTRQVRVRMIAPFAQVKETRLRFHRLAPASTSVRLLFHACRRVSHTSTERAQSNDMMMMTVLACRVRHVQRASNVKTAAKRPALRYRIQTSNILLILAPAWSVPLADTLQMSQTCRVSRAWSASSAREANV